MIINFNQNTNYLLEVRDCLKASELWISLDIVDQTLWLDADYVSLSHSCHLLQLGCSIPVHSIASIEQLYGICNEFNGTRLSKAFFDKDAVRLQIDLHTQGGVACNALLNTTELFYMDMLKLEKKLEGCGFFDPEIERWG